MATSGRPASATETALAGPDAVGAVTGLLTVGAEEEFLLVDAVTGRAVGAVDETLEAIPPNMRVQVQREYLTSQIEIASAPVSDLAALGRSLGALRSEVADAAIRRGVRLVAVGASVIGTEALPIVDDPRFHRMNERFGALSPGAGLNGCHSHVGVPSQALGAQVLNHLRPWLPVLHAATTNSPFHAGTDTGYASWRTVLWARWPSVGPTPYLESEGHYHAIVEELIGTGAMLDEAMLYWYARLSARYPTVEVRLGDVCPTVDDTVLLAALTRGLVATALDDVGRGLPAPRVPDHLLVAAHWRAARDGLEGMAVDVLNGRLRPAWHLMRRLVGLVRPALERHGDLPLVTALLSRLRAQGTGAARQRATFVRHGDPAAVLAYLIRQTRAHEHQ